MKTIYLFIAIILFSVSFTSCTAEDISESVATTQYADDDDTGGQNGQINPPPPPAPTIP